MSAPGGMPARTARSGPGRGRCGSLPVLSHPPPRRVRIALAQAPRAHAPRIRNPALRRSSHRWRRAGRAHVRGTPRRAPRVAGRRPDGAALDMRTWANELDGGAASKKVCACIASRPPSRGGLTSNTVRGPCSRPTRCRSGRAHVSGSDGRGPTVLSSWARSRRQPADLVVFYPYLYEPTVFGIETVGRGRSCIRPRTTSRRSGCPCSATSLPRRADSSSRPTRKPPS